VREPGSQAAINGVCYRRSTGALATSGRNEFARIAFLPGTVQAADLHQEVVQSLAVHPRSGNCPRSHCRGLLGDKIVRGAGVDCQSPATRFSLFGSPRWSGQTRTRSGGSTSRCRAHVFLYYYDDAQNHRIGRKRRNGWGTSFNRPFCDGRHRRWACPGV